MSAYQIVDLFAGPGGWDEALRMDGRGDDVIGIEWDDAACLTRHARGHHTRQADVAEVDPLEYAAIDGLIASPPCQAWSMAGARKGEIDRSLVENVAKALAAGRDERAAAVDEAADPRSILAVEPLRWALALRPRWIACEQVPPVLGLWELFAGYLRDVGYSTWTGILTAEQYGVPQTRKRAFLVARRDGIAAAPPAPTHRRYVVPRRRRADEAALGMFDLPEPERITYPGEEQLAPWISMAEALGCGFDDQPSVTVTSGGGASGGVEVFGNAATRDRLAMVANAQANASEWAENRPSPTITSGGGRDNGLGILASSEYRARWAEAKVAALGEDGAREGKRWKYNARDQRDGRTGEPNRMRQVDEPAPTIAGESRNDSWMLERPAATVQGDPRIAEPGWRGSPDDYAPDGAYIGKRSMENAVRVTESEAAILQSFPADYPWQGTKSKRFEQIGNAVPPLLARAVLAPLLPNIEGATR